jgi:tRNA-dihydrouridine synthase
MVGRGAIGNPWIFGQIDDEWHGRAAREPGIAERLAVIERHLRSALAGFETWAKKDRERQEAERRAVSYCKGHLVRYLRAGPDYAGFLRKLNDLRDINDTLAAARAALAGDRAGRWPGPTRCPDDEAA